MGTLIRQNLLMNEHGDAHFTGDSDRVIGRSRIDKHNLVQQRDFVEKFSLHDANDVAYGFGLIQGRQS